VCFVLCFTLIDYVKNTYRPLGQCPALGFYDDFFYQLIKDQSFSDQSFSDQSFSDQSFSDQSFSDQSLLYIKITHVE
jgi:hypothetical protein